MLPTSRLLNPGHLGLGRSYLTLSRLLQHGELLFLSFKVYTPQEKEANCYLYQVWHVLAELTHTHTYTFVIIAYLEEGRLGNF